MWDKIVPVLIGAAAGILSFIFVGWIEGEKQFEIKKAEAFATFLSDSWGDGQVDAKPVAPADDSLVYTRAVSALTVYASKQVLNALSRYQDGNGCGVQNEPSACRILWAKVVNAMRRDLDQEIVDDASIATVLWGTPRQR